MKYGSVCSGIEAATAAWHPLGWTPAWFSEIEPFPSAVLAHHYPAVPNLGDMTKFKEWKCDSIDLLVGGTPCQSFSVAGLRKGMADPRGNLALVFLAIADRLRPRWVVWENVPGVLSSAEGRDFGCFLGGLGELRYGFAYRILDAQYFGVPQRRRRVFVVGHLGDWRRAAAVLFERSCLQGNPPPSREAGQRVAPCAEGRAGRSGANNFATSGGPISDEDRIAVTLRGRSNASHRVDTDTYIPHIVPQAIWPAEVAPTLNAAFGDKQGLEDQHALHGAGLFVPSSVTHSLRAEGHDASEGGTGRGTPLVPIGFSHQKSAMSTTPAVAFTQNQAGDVLTGDKSAAMGTNQNATGRNTPKVQDGMQVRRLTPTECERLQGFSDDYTLVPFRKKSAADGPRYKALGNSMAVPVMAWIGKRIEMAKHL